MESKGKYYLGLLLLVTLFALAKSGYCQSLTKQVNSSAGGYYKQTSGSLSFTIGEPLAETYSNGITKLSQGFQQGNYSITAFDEMNVSGIQSSLYPNPARDIINLRIQQDQGQSEYFYELADMAGKILEKKQVKTNEENPINLSALQSGIYFLKTLSRNSQYSKNYKIQKIK